MASRSEERRERILTAAVEAFAAEGFQGASTARIAAAAGASKETIYRYFGDKEGLLSAALTTLVSSAEASDRDQLPEPALPFEARIHRFALDLVTDLMQPAYLALARIVVAETPRDPRLADVFREAVAGRALARVAVLLAEGQRDGVVDPDVALDAAARALVGPLLTYVLLDGLLRSSDEVEPPTTAAVRAQVDVYLDGIRTSDRSRKAR